MSITSSFYSGLSGLDTHATAMQVIGDNIANIHTTGFKSSTANFQDVLGKALTGVSGSNQTGAGAKISTVDLNFIQGSLETTNVSTDVAVNGKGFFTVGDPLTDELFYTRAGHFIIDNQGYYVNPQGYRVQGYRYDNTGTMLIENLDDIRLNQNSIIPPQVTSAINMVLNLNASETVKTWDPADPFNTSSFSTSVNIYDSLGQSHQILLYFTKTAGQRWEWHSLIDGADVDGGTAGSFQDFGNGTLDFNTSGQLTTAMPITFHAGGMTFSNGSASTVSNVNFTGTSQYGSPSVIQIINQDGCAAGTVSGVSIDGEGNFVAYYTNGTRRNIARLALADFSNLNGLVRKGANLYEATTTSGDPLYNKPGVGGMGTISSSMVEGSNVDLAAELIKMIIIQRGYQVNTKVITTTDEMLAHLINIR
ncbi:MAG: flagellar hook protein FlgE [Deltaproteobacteria bacterium]|nr:flagellar hook protein FlgE [Deltaproteobacteria bacterium]